MHLRVSTEVQPAVFKEEELSVVDARVLQWVHKGWLSVEVDAERLADLRGLRGVENTLTVTACDDRLDQLPADLQWQEVASGDCHGLIDFRIEGGRTSSGRMVAVRQTAVARGKCFLRSHRTQAMDMALYALPGRSLVARHSTGLRDGSVAGMHDWKQEETHTITMWVGHVPPGAYAVVGGVDGWVRVKTKLLPWHLEANLNL